MSPYRTIPLVLVSALGACTSASQGAGPGGTDEPDAAADSSIATGSPSDASPDVPLDAPPLDSGASTPVGTAPAGKAGVDAFCSAVCDHEQACGAIDAGASSLTSCVSTFQAFYELAGASPWGANPPLELYRADYVNALGACIAASSCSESLSASEARCSEGLVAGVDGGAPAIAPTAAATTVCHSFDASTCLAADSGAQDCLAELMLFNDEALTSANACFSMSPCSAVSNCFATAFTQP